MLPFCLTRIFSTGGAAVKTMLSYCAVTTLYVHPFSNCLLSAFTHGPLCLLTCFAFATVFKKCLVTKALALFVLFHVVRKMSFNVIAIDKGAVIVSVVPSSHHKRKLKCCKLTGGVTVSVKPVAKLFLRSTKTSCALVFYYSLNSYLVKFLYTSLMGAACGPPMGQRPVSLSHFVLLGKVPTNFDLLLLSVPCNVAAGCITVCTGRVNVRSSANFFFAFVTLKVTISHLFSKHLMSQKVIARIVRTNLCLIYFYFFNLDSYK